MTYGERVFTTQEEGRGWKPGENVHDPAITLRFKNRKIKATAAFGVRKT